MRKIISSLLSLAAVFTMASCQQDKLIDDSAAKGDGTLVDATFSVALGPQTRSFSDGTMVDKLYVGIYEIGANDKLTWVVDNSGAPAAISQKTATVTFNGKLVEGKSYKVVFWAQKEGAPYAIEWSKTATTGPIVTVTPSGNANDESRDAFYGSYDTGVVTGDIDLTGSPVNLKRPFAQVNVLVPNSYIEDPTAAVTSSMTVAQAPTTLNLATKATGTPKDWTFSTSSIAEAAFGSYSNTHKYVAMNYVLVDQSTTTPHYDVTFSVSVGTQLADNKSIVNVPLRPNGRCIIVGNIFDDDFNFTVPIIIDPGYDSEDILTTVTVAVGQTEDDAFELTPNTTSSVEVVLNHTIESEAEMPEITVEPSSVATAEWNLSTGKLDITPLVENGSALITLLFPVVTRAEYTAAIVSVYVKVGNGQNTTPPGPKLDQTLSFAHASEEAILGSSYTLQAVSGARTNVTYSSSNETVATINGTTVTLVGTGETTITATAVEDDAYNSATATYTLTVVAATPIIPDFTTVSELKDLLSDESATFSGTLTNAVVSFIASTSDAVIKDATASILYHKETGHGLLQGQTISGNVTVEAVVYNGINEITDLTATVKGEGYPVEPEVVTLATLAANYATYESAYVKVVGVTSQTTTTTKGNITGRQSGTDFIIYTNVAIPVNAGDVFTAEGTVTKYNTTELLKVWKAADLTVTTAAPLLSATPATTTVKANVTSVTWTIESNTNWTIAPGPGVTASATSGNGNADVTLIFAENTGSEAATYTATASATGCDDVTITITQSAAGSSSDITDTITSALLTATSTTYTDFSNVAATSSARYAGNSAKSSSGGIQLRSKNSNSGIVSTVSGGKVKSVTITVESGSNTIDVYGSNTAYTSAADVYATGEGGNPGTKIGSLTATGTITVTGQYAYVGIRSNNGAVYITSIDIVWE